MKIKKNPIFLSYFDRNKKLMFPEIKDWTDSQDNLRNQRNIKKMKYGEWMFFHPSSYKFYYFSTVLIPLTLCLTTITLMAIRGSMFVVLILGLFSALLVRDLYKKIKNLKYIKDLTFYDLYMREYKEE